MKPDVKWTLQVIGKGDLTGSKLLVTRTGYGRVGQLSFLVGDCVFESDKDSVCTYELSEINM